MKVISFNSLWNFSFKSLKWFQSVIFPAAFFTGIEKTYFDGSTHVFFLAAYTQAPIHEWLKLVTPCVAHRKLLMPHCISVALFPTVKMITHLQMTHLLNFLLRKRICTVVLLFPLVFTFGLEKAEVANMERERLKLALQDRPLRSELKSLNDLHEGRLKTTEVELRQCTAELSNRLQVSGSRGDT